MDREAPPSPPGTMPSEKEEEDKPGAPAGSGSGAGTGEGADPPPDPTVDAAAGERFGGGTGGGIYADTPVPGQGVGEAGGTQDVDDSEQGKAAGSRLVSDQDTRALILEIKAGVKEVLREQHATYLAKIDRGVLLQEDVLDRLRAIQRSLDSSPMTNKAALDALAPMVTAPKMKTARPQLAALAPQSQDDFDFEHHTEGKKQSEDLASDTPGSRDHKVAKAWRKNPAHGAQQTKLKSILMPPPSSGGSRKKDEKKKKDVYISDVDSQPPESIASSSSSSDDSLAGKRVTAASSKSQSDQRAQSEPTNSESGSVPLQRLASEARRKRGLPSQSLPKLPGSLSTGLRAWRDQESLATGRSVRQSMSEVKEWVQKANTSGRASLILPPQVTEDAGGDQPTSRRSNFSQRFQSFSVVPSEVRRQPESEEPEDDEEQEDEEGEESEDGRRRRKKKKKGTRKPARRNNHGPMRHAGWDIPLPSVRDREVGFWTKITKHPSFDFFSGALIVASTVVAGTETNYMAQNQGNTTESYYIVKLFFLCCFTVELTLRMLGAGMPDFFLKKDRGWNWFDFIMVGASVFEVIVQLAQGGDNTSPSGGGQGRILRILRIVRISRALRLGRVLRYARTFRQIVYSLQSSIVTLFWAMVMIFLVVYCFAVCFCQAWTEWVSDPNEVPMPPAVSLELQLLYSSLGRSFYSLFMAMTGGRSWGELLSPLMYISELYTVLFVLFICLTYFGVLNVVAAIFVDSAMQSQQHYKDLLIQDNVEKKELFSQHLREVFFEIDRDGSGHINGDEMEFFLADPSLNLYLESIDIFPNDARSLFRLLDRDGSGEVSIEEFCQGCLRLKGEAKSFDIHCLIYANDRSQRKLDQIINWLTQAVPLD